MGSIAKGQDIYNQEVSCEITENNADSGFWISLQKGRYIEIEKPSGDFDENEINGAISVKYEGKVLHFTKENGYALAVPDGGATIDGQDSGLKVGAPFTCDEDIYERNGINITTTDTSPEGDKSYTLSGTGTCKLRFKDNRKGVWLAGTDGSECGYVEVLTYANKKDWENNEVKERGKSRRILLC